MGRLFKSVVFYALLILYLLFLMNTWFLMMHFSTGTGLERVGVVGSDLNCWRARL